MQQLTALVPLIIIIAIFYFFIIRPQSKQQKQLQEMRESMKIGDEVLTIGGFYGVIYAIDDQNVVLEMLPDFNKAMVIKTAISKVISAEESLIVNDTETEEDGNEIEESSVEAVETPETDEKKESQE